MAGSEAWRASDTSDTGGAGDTGEAGEAWSVEAVLVPHGSDVERWWLDGGILREGRPGPSVAAEALPGRFVLPGLVDAHTHLAMEFAGGAGTVVGDVDGALARHLAAGVTAVRDVGVPTGCHVERGRGRVDRPDVVGAPSYLAPADRYFPALYEPTAPEDAAAAAAAQVAAGGDWVKVIADSPMTEGSFFGPGPTYEPEVLAAVVEAVHAAGGRVAAHVTGERVREAVRAGVDSVEHGSLLDEDLLAALAARGGAWTPTAGTVLGAVARLEAMGVEPVLALARPHVEALRAAVPAAERLGVTVLAGTDMLGHGDLAGEVAALVALGLSPVAALDAASGAARRYLGLPGLEPGQPAELVTYDDDPREDPAVLARPVAVVHAGRRVR